MRTTTSPSSRKTGPNPKANESRTVALSAIGGGATVLAILALVWFLASGSGKTSSAPTAGQIAPPAAAQASVPETSTEFPRASVDDLRKLQEQGKAVVIDVRDVESYKAAHIPGALHIPLSFIEGELPYLPKDKTIITYCTCPAEESSGGATVILRKNGFESSALLGGLDAWQAAGLPLKSGVEKPPA